MKVLIIGSGGREHAIGWKINKDNPSTELYFYPGNAGTAKLGENVPGPLSLNGITTFAKTENIDLTIVGPEKELAEGIVDMFQAERLQIFGPEKKEAILESSKVYAKEFMQKYGWRFIS